MRSDDPVAVSLIQAIRAGDLEALARLLAEHPGLATTPLEDDRGGARTPLHVATDWPGYFPNGPAVVRALLDAGADPNVPGAGSGFGETPLHWAASSDDADVAEALLDGGADLEIRGGSIADGPPLANAVGYGCWHVARLLVARGAQAETLWQAAALGLTAGVEELLAGASSEEIVHAFWQACHGGQRRVAERLLARGADIHFRPDYAQASATEIAGTLDTRRQTMVAWLREAGGS